MLVYVSVFVLVHVCIVCMCAQGCVKRVTADQDLSRSVFKFWTLSDPNSSLRALSKCNLWNYEVDPSAQGFDPGHTGRLMQNLVGPAG